MAHVLKNDILEIQIDLPLENYNFSRFDWTGKIVSVKYKNLSISGVEALNIEDDTKSGKGFYNEFGFKTPFGFAETKVGDWFHKIGIGLLKKECDDYLFSHKYEIQPAEFNVSTTLNSLILSCKSANLNGYSYFLKKEISLIEGGFIINYHLKNTGEKTIITDEYNHNFITVNNEMIGSDYILKFPFDIIPELFEENVNLESKVEINQKEIGFNGIPKEQFFFSNLSGGEKIEASWVLINYNNKIGISEKGNFKTTKVNVWGWQHVISPELYFDINIKPGKELEWSRTYTIFES
jgi:hypothetical protein